MTQPNLSPLSEEQEQRLDEIRFVANYAKNSVRNNGGATDGEGTRFLLSIIDHLLSLTTWRPIEEAPKDTPVLAWCKYECDDPGCVYNGGNSNFLCIYHGHAETFTSAGDGPVVTEWGGAWDDRTYEEPTAGWMPDWWFKAGTDFEVAANPTHYLPLLPGPKHEQEGE